MPAVAKARSAWTTISLTPLTGLLDLRSRPADLPAGSLRQKLNFSTTSEGKLSRRDGFQRAWFDFLYDSAGTYCGDPGNHCSKIDSTTGLPDPLYNGVWSHNHDFHARGRARKQLTYMQEISWSDGTRMLVAGDENYVSKLDEVTGYWTDIVTGKGTFGSVWRGAVSQDVVMFVNGFDDIFYYEKTLGGVNQTVPALLAIGIRSAKVIVMFSGMMVIMNLNIGGKPFMSRIWWSDLNKPLVWGILTPADSISNFQDLDYGDEILAAAELAGSLYIYTRRSIWKMSVASAPDTFSFTRVYREPKNQTGCIVYPYTLVSTGLDHYYMSRDGIYRYNPYVPQPVRDDWLHRASGLIFTKKDTKMSGVLCNLPCSEFRPEKRELWFSWPSGIGTANNLCMVAQIEFNTADLVDAGFSSFVNFRRKVVAEAICNERQTFLGASGLDWSIKDIGDVFFREFVKLIGNDPAVDGPVTHSDTDGWTYTVGYVSQLRGLIPTGFFDREKKIREVLLDHDTTDEVRPCYVHCRIGNSFHLIDPNDQDPTCSPMWRELVSPNGLVLQCPDTKTVPQMRALNQRPSEATVWPALEEGRFLYFEFSITNKDGSPAIGGDSDFSKIDFDVTAGNKA